jgi:hypothetical protein
LVVISFMITVLRCWQPALPRAIAFLATATYLLSGKRAIIVLYLCVMAGLCLLVLTVALAEAAFGSWITFDRHVFHLGMELSSVGWAPELQTNDNPRSGLVLMQVLAVLQLIGTFLSICDYNRQYGTKVRGVLLGAMALTVQ